jgi:hypothetical protein
VILALIVYKMEEFINSLDLKDATQESASQVYDQMDKLRRAGQIKSANLQNCIKALQSKVAVADLCSADQPGYYCAMHCFKEIHDEMK